MPEDVKTELAPAPMRISVADPRSISDGGAALLEFSPEQPQGRRIGTVIYSPNIPREFHSGYDPRAGDDAATSEEWFGKLVYVAAEDPEATRLSSSLGLMGAATDHIDSNGCSRVSRNTYLQRLDVAGKTPVLETSQGQYSVLAAKVQDLANGRWVVEEFWVARNEHRDLLERTPEHAQALQEASRIVAAPPGPEKRARVRAHIRKLAGS